MDRQHGGILEYTKNERLPVDVLNLGSNTRIMNISAQLARHLRDVHFGGNWTTSNMRDNLKDVTWLEATTRVHSLNTIAVLVFHINYYIAAVAKVLEGAPLNASDALSFDHRLCGRRKTGKPCLTRRGAMQRILPCW